MENDDDEDDDDEVDNEDQFDDDEVDNEDQFDERDGLIEHVVSDDISSTQIIIDTECKSRALSNILMTSVFIVVIPLSLVQITRLVL